jgi:hypothetical protein
MSKENIFDAIEGLFIGILATIVLLFSFQSYIPYPEMIVKIAEHPWIIVLGYIFAIILGRFSPKLSVLILLLLTAFVLELFLFTRPIVSKEIEHHNSMKYSPVQIIANQSTIDTKYNDNFTEEHKGYPLHDILLPAPVYPLFDNVNFDTNAGLINGANTN